ncbi:hypothetical protein C8Q80DRAFT_197605 [Daedaleopsis nitida]|nr:hypothetical protein C8Q80DRAFT_197605 [Daedaleopsis nitida]
MRLCTAPQYKTHRLKQAIFPPRLSPSTRSTTRLDMRRTALTPLLSVLYAFSVVPGAHAYCYIDGFGRERCTLSTGVRIGIAIASHLFSLSWLSSELCDRRTPGAPTCSTSTPPPSLAQSLPAHLHRVILLQADILRMGMVVPHHTNPITATPRSIRLKHTTHILRFVFHSSCGMQSL